MSAHGNAETDRPASLHLLSQSHGSGGHRPTGRLTILAVSLAHTAVEWEKSGGQQMSRIRRHPHREDIKRNRRRTKQYLALFVVFLIAIVLALAITVGEAVWPAWLIEHRTQIIGIGLLAILITICLSPVIIEANSNPHHLSGPGKNPEQGLDPYEEHPSRR